ncbi:hypothetical protein L218DRAFT_1018728 [Marasmius fiardii PR-910]|nr:hypothetical protein L218DRAFT_1018728 [Marasmius fiardii PR-910]
MLTTRGRIYGWQPAQTEGDEVEVPPSQPCQVYMFSVHSSDSQYLPHQLGTGVARTISLGESPPSSFFDGRDAHDPPKKGDPDWVPRPKNCWIIFRREYVKTRHESGQGKSDDTLSKEASVAWSCLSAKEREHYEMLAEQEKLEHARRYPFYRYRPKKKAGSGTPIRASHYERVRPPNRRRASSQGSGTKGEESRGRRGQDTPCARSDCGGSPSMVARHVDRNPSFTSSEESYGPATGRSISVERPVFEHGSPSTCHPSDSSDTSSVVDLTSPISNSSALDEATITPYSPFSRTTSSLEGWNCLPPSPHTMPPRPSQLLVNYIEDWRCSSPSYGHDSESPPPSAKPNLELRGDLNTYRPYDGVSTSAGGTPDNCAFHGVEYSVEYSVVQTASLMESPTFSPSSAEEDELFARLINL